MKSLHYLPCLGYANLLENFKPINLKRRRASNLHVKGKIGKVAAFAGGFPWSIIHLGHHTTFMAHAAHIRRQRNGKCENANVMKSRWKCCEMQMGLSEKRSERVREGTSKIGNPFQLISVFIDLRQEAIKFTFRNINMTMRCRMPPQLLLSYVQRCVANCCGAVCKAIGSIDRSMV